jgi:hypothetical protein
MGFCRMLRTRAQENYVIKTATRHLIILFAADGVAENRRCQKKSTKLATYDY